MSRLRRAGRLVAVSQESAPPEAEARRLDDLNWPELADWFRRDPRLLLPVGGCIQHGPHLPLGTDNRITERLAVDVCARTGILMAPLMPYGVASREDLAYAGTAGLERKTLHRVLNELVASWERQGLEEITLLTTNGNARNIQALAMVIGDTVRVRSVDTRAIDVSRYLTSATSDHAGEFETSIMLHVAPGLVRAEAVEDLAADMAGRAEPPPVRGTAGVVGTPTSANAQKGSEIYEHLVDSIVGRLGALDP